MQVNAKLSELFNVTVSSLLAEEVDFSIQACGVATNISEKLVGSIPQFTYSVIHAQTNTRIHACLESPRSAGLTGMNEARSLHVLFPKGLSQSRSLPLFLCRSLARLLARSFRLPRETVLRLSPAAPLHHPTVLHPLPCRFRIENDFQRSAHHRRESISLFGGQEVPAQIANRKLRHAR